ncbi:MAG: hypothetical protein U0269_08075 [Polyangiales bacterium]
MRRRRAAVVVALLVQLGFVLACSAPGQRASMSVDGSAPCLPGETCSSLAPAGLRFSTLSHAPLGAPPAVTAVGGAQTVFFTGASGGDLSATVDRGLGTATVNPAQPDTTPSFVFKPQSEGDALVSIRERASRALLDRITLSAAVARQVDLRVRWGIFGTRPLGAIWAGASVRTEAFASSFAAGAQVDLVDDAWSMSSSDSTVLAVDHRTLRARREGFSSVQIRIGDSTLPRGVSVVSTIDALEVVDAATGEALSSPWPVSDRLLMVRGRAGRTPVEGAPITMTPSHPEVSPESAALLDPEDPAFYLLPTVEVAAPRRLPVVFRSGAVELRGELLLAPRS